MANQILDWLPKDSKETAIFFEYCKIFKEGELLMISWEGCTREDIRLNTIAERLLSPPEGETLPLFQKVWSTRSLLEELTDRPLNLRSKDARARLRGWMIGRDDQTGCLVAIVSETGVKNRAKAIVTVHQITQEETGLGSENIYIAGPSIDSIAIDQITEKSQQLILPFFFLLCFTLLLLCLRSVFAAVLLFLIAAMNEELGASLLYWSGTQIDSISMLIGSLVYVLTISAGVHLINYYRESLKLHDVKDAPSITVKKAALPCSLAVLTTVLGLGSLAVSKMTPIRHFGIFASITLALGTLWLFLIVPVLLQQFPFHRWKRKEEQNPSGTFQHRLIIFWEKFAIQIRKSATPITVFSFLLLVFFVIGLIHLQTTVTFHGMFPKSAKVIRDYDILETRIGGLIPIEVVLRIPQKGNENSTPFDQLYFLESAQKTLTQVDGVDSAMSVLNFLPNLPANERSVAVTMRRSLLRSLLPQYMDQLKNSSLFAQTEGVNGENLWRISLRIPAHRNMDYQKLLRELGQRMEEIGASASASNLHGFHFEITGGVPLVHRAQEQLLNDLINSFLTAFLLIALIMMLLLRGIITGLLAMIPNIFPCVLVFGAMGWLGYPVDMGSMMTASVAIGIAVDGTLHFATWFYDGLKNGMERRDAVVFAYRQCATALTQTTIICGFGMLVFSASDFLPISQFSVLLCLLLWMALISDLIVFPAILFSPLGCLFDLPKNDREPPSDVMCPIFSGIRGARQSMSR